MISRLKRLGRWPIAVLLALGAIAVIVYPALSGSGDEGQLEPTDLQPPPTRMVAARVERLRGLEFEHLPKVVLLDPAELESKAEGVRKRALEHLSARRRARLRRARVATIEILKLSGLVGSDFSVRQTRASQSERVGGLYETTPRRVILVTHPGETQSQLEVSMAHELDHALDAQHFGALFHRRVTPAHAEVGAAARALIEGTATRVEEEYARRYLGEAHPASSVGSALFGPENYAVGLPPPLAAEFRFPYTSGTRFVRSLLRRENGWRLVNAGFRRPPTSTAQVLHPGRWRPGARSPRLRFDLAPELGDGWRRLGGGDSGELDATVLLAFGAGPEEARQAAAGWDGGWYEVWRRRGRGRPSCEPPCRRDNAAVLGYRWDTPADARQFTEAAARYLGTGLFADPRPRLTWRLAGGYAALGLSGRGAAIAYAPSAGLARKLAVRVVFSVRPAVP
jgi:hypothetical protein